MKRRNSRSITTVTFLSYPNMTLRPFDVADEADRRTRAGDVQGVVTLLDAEVDDDGIRKKVWQEWKCACLEGVLRSFHHGTHSFPEQVLRALMRYTSPAGGMFVFESLGHYKLVWDGPPGDRVRFPRWNQRTGKALDGFAKAWFAERTRWSVERAAWVAAVVDDMKTCSRHHHGHFCSCGQL